MCPMERYDTIWTNVHLDLAFLSVLFQTNVILSHWWRRQGCNCTPIPFDLVKILTKWKRSQNRCYVLWFYKNGTQNQSADIFFARSCFYFVHFGHVRGNLGKNDAWGVLWFKHIRPTWEEMQSFFSFGGHFLWSFFQASSGTFGQKSLPPKKFACSYTYALSLYWNYFHFQVIDIEV